MDNKRLLHILLKDIVDLEDLVLGLRTSGTSDPLDFELLYTKIAGVRHLLEAMGQREEKPVSSQAAPVPEKKAAKEVFSGSPIPVSDIPGAWQTEIVEEYHPESRKIHPEEKPGMAVPVPEPQPEPVSLTEPVAEPQPEPEAVEIPEYHEDLPVDSGEGDDVELEEVAASGKQTLGERFVQGRSVNDLLLEHAKSESRFSNLPVASLQAAIGINDRFLFTRELFDGNAKAFSEVIQKLDNMPGIHEAAIYLRENFKWKKTETSLKFIDLVKRRFM